MPRPCKCRRVECELGVTYFKPQGIPVYQLQEVILTVDELEAVRLADLEELYQEAAAERMNVSRQTFGNIINSAHKKIADVIVNGKALNIEGGTYIMAEKRKFTCSDCNYEWEVAYGATKPQACPKCSGSNIHRAEQDKGYAGRGGSGKGICRCRRMGQ